ncbi:probable glutamate receptor [Palaemon carinicauda]|uniref:probable glutamate receptor n=1 Tax=Palaemon carinicauda TaxID=392227 RepID=UPI0035B5DD2C
MALGGRHLIVAAEKWSPWVIFKEEPDGSLLKSGIVIDMFNTIAEKMNFTYSVKRPPDVEWGRELPNGSFTGMIGMCQRNEVDVALGPFVMSWDRYQAADYSTTIYFDQYGILLPRPRHEIDLSGIAKPLAWQVWLTLAVAICVSIVIGFFMNFAIQKIRRGYPSSSDEINSSWISKVMLTETVYPLPKSFSSRLYIITWMIVGFILQAAYSGVLISLIAVPKVTIPVDSLQDLISYGKFPWIIEVGSYLHNTFQRAESGLYKEVLHGVTIVDDFYSLREWVKKEQVAVLVPITNMKKVISDDYSATGKCNFYIAREAILSAPFALAFPKGSALTPIFDKWLSLLKESGEISHSILGETTNATACLVRPGKEAGKGYTPFSLMDLSGIFLLSFVGTTISLIALLLEMIISKAG